MHGFAAARRPHALGRFSLVVQRGKRFMKFTLFIWDITLLSEAR
jgi:hypothetical protein